MAFVTYAYRWLSVTTIQQVSEADGLSCEPFAIWGSAGFLEVAVRGDSAAGRLAAEAGSELHLHVPTAASQGAVFATRPAHEW
ncbi:MAG: SAM-dependent chlorinase/fluorinase [Gemmatimonadetes bacterium]|nr:SAM-dependent chlorinase/fluorinase [Gemmatimonadota bacterium]